MYNGIAQTPHRLALSFAYPIFGGTALVAFAASFGMLIVVWQNSLSDVTKRALIASFWGLAAMFVGATLGAAVSDSWNMAAGAAVGALVAYPIGSLIVIRVYRPAPATG